MSAPLAPDAGKAEPRISLRVLGTSDLHMRLLPYDDLRDRPAPGLGLATLATLIARARQGAANCLLFDNGDSLEGQPTGEYLAEPGALGDRPHPLIAAMNLMGYDGATLGNHDFNFGLDYLVQILPRADYPVVVSNAGFDQPMPILPHLLLERDLTDSAGQSHRLRIGVLGFIPPQTPMWEGRISGRVRVHDILLAGTEAARALRVRGADLVIALCHSGLSTGPYQPAMENAAAALATVDGIDAVIAGHSHQIFPSDQFPGSDFDAAAGLVAGKPLAMPGFWGSHLAVLDLDIEQTATGWRSTGGRGAVWPCADLPPDPSIARMVEPLHRATRQRLDRRIGPCGHALYSHFSLLGHDPAAALVGAATARHVRTMLAGSEWQDLPILGAASPLRAGGRNGAEQFTEIPAGGITERGLFDLYPFANDIAAVLVTGADLAEWIERSASLFHRILPGLGDQTLRRPEFPAYHHDVIYGLSYVIDPGQPARFDGDGRLSSPDATRVLDLRHHGRAIRPDERFVLATNRYRIAGCGLFGPLTARLQVLQVGTARVLEVLRDFVASGAADRVPSTPVWRFAPMSGTSVLHETGPNALRYLDELPFAVETAGVDPEGFLRLRLAL